MKIDLFERTVFIQILIDFFYRLLQGNINILLTGGFGFVGMNIIYHLLKIDNVNYDKIYLIGREKILGDDFKYHVESYPIHLLYPYFHLPPIKDLL